MKKKLFIVLGACIVCICVIVVIFICLIKTNWDDVRFNTKKKVQSYNQETNEQGIAVDMRDNPYYKNRQPGYYYRTPEIIEYYSKVTETNRHAVVMLPSNYDENKKYPVLYLLHGLDGSHKTWRNKSGHIIIQNLAYFYGGKEMIVVCPNSELNDREDTGGLSDKEKCKFYDLTERDLIGSLMPYINSNYSVKTDRDNTAICGHSMGGRNSLYIAFKHQNMFGYVGAFSCAPILGDTSDTTKVERPLLEEFKMDEDVEPFKLLFLMVGREDDDCGNVSYEVHAHMKGRGIKHIFYDVEGGHENKVWQNGLYNFAKRLFQ